MAPDISQCQLCSRARVLVYKATVDGFMKFYESEKRSAAVAAQPTMTSAVAVKVFLRWLNIAMGVSQLNESWMGREG